MQSLHKPLAVIDDHIYLYDAETEAHHPVGHPDLTVAATASAATGSGGGGGDDTGIPGARACGLAMSSLRQASTKSSLVVALLAADPA